MKHGYIEEFEIIDEPAAQPPVRVHRHDQPQEGSWTTRKRVVSIWEARSSASSTDRLGGQRRRRGADIVIPPPAAALEFDDCFARICIVCVTASCDLSTQANVSSLDIENR